MKKIIIQSIEISINKKNSRMMVSLSIPEVGLVILILVLLILVFVLVLIVFWTIFMLWRALVIYHNNISDGLRKKKECEKNYIGKVI